MTDNSVWCVMAGKPGDKAYDLQFVGASRVSALAFADQYRAAVRRGEWLTATAGETTYWAHGTPTVLLLRLSRVQLDVPRAQQESHPAAADAEQAMIGLLGRRAHEAGEGSHDDRRLDDDPHTHSTE